MSAAAVLTPALALTRRELVRFLRQRNRVIGALATPIVFWLLLGAGMGRSFSGPGSDGGFLPYFLPGVVLMTVLFVAIFSTISIIEDRREGFLQSVLVAPVGRPAVVLGKIFGGTILAVGQALIVLLLAPFAGMRLTPVGVLGAAGVLVAASVLLTAAGVCLAWPMKTTQGFHVMMNLLLMPAWMLSGAAFPLRADTNVILKVIMLANPLTYALGWLRASIGQPSGLPVSIAVSAGITLIAAVALTLAAIALAGRASRHDHELT